MQAIGQSRPFVTRVDEAANKWKSEKAPSDRLGSVYNKGVMNCCFLFDEIAQKTKPG
jgi:hypothetical protein